MRNDVFLKYSISLLEARKKHSISVSNGVPKIVQLWG